MHVSSYKDQTYFWAFSLYSYTFLLRNEQIAHNFFLGLW